jgi:hypothetical protein
VQEVRVHDVGAQARQLGAVIGQRLVRLRAERVLALCSV